MPSATHIEHSHLNYDMPLVLNNVRYPRLLRSHIVYDDQISLQFAEVHISICTMKF